MDNSKLKFTKDGLVMFYCPGCKCHHGIYTEQSTPNPLTGARWTWNGDSEKPTFAPSILVRGTIPPTDVEVALIMSGQPFEPVPFVCHSFVRNGQVEYLSDCTHELVGQTVTMFDVDDD